MIDLDFFCWRERAVDTDGQARLLIPHADPQVYEDPIDEIFTSEGEAKAFLDAQHPGENLVLMHYTGVVVGDYAAKGEQDGE